MQKSVLLFLLWIWCSATQAQPFKGIVLAPNGQPVSGAQVWIGVAGGLSYAENEDTLRRVETNAAGIFSIQFPDRPGALPQAYARVQAAGFATQDVIVEAANAGASPAMNIFILRAPRLARGMVHDLQGKAVPNAKVAAVLLASENIAGLLEDKGFPEVASLSLWAAALPPIETHSDEQGTWTIEALPDAIIALHDERFAYHSISVLASQLMLPNRPISSVSSGSSSSAINNRSVRSIPMILLALPIASLQGRLLDIAGKPVSGALVRSESDAFHPPAISDQSGNFTLTNLPAGPDVLCAFANSPNWFFLPYYPALKSGETIKIPDWQAVAGTEMRGTLVDGKTGVPLTRAKVMYGLNLPVVTDATGRFFLRVMSVYAPNVNLLRFSAPDFAPLWHSVTGPEQPQPKENEIPVDPATMRAEPPKPIDIGRIALQPLPVLKGRVIDENGVAARSVILIATRSDNPERRLVPTNHEGFFEMRNVSGSLILTMADDGFVLQPDRVVKIDSPENAPLLALKVQRQTRRKTTGRVITEAKVPVAGVTVKIKVGRPRPGDLNNAMLIKEEIAVTDAEGRFEVDVSPETKIVKVTEINGAGYSIVKAGEHQSDDQGINTLQITDSIVRFTARLNGRVLSAQGNPQSGALVMVLENRKYEPLTTDAEGKFSMPMPIFAANAQQTLIAAHGFDFARVIIDDKAGAGGLELRLLPPGTINGKLRRAAFESLIKGGVASLDSFWSVLGSEKIGVVALQADGALTPGVMEIEHTDWNRSGKNTLRFLQEVGRRNAPWLRANGANWLSRIPEQEADREARWQAERAIALALAYGDENQRALSLTWLDFSSKTKDALGETERNATRWFQLAGLAGALSDNRAKNFTLTALSLAEQAGAATINRMAQRWGEMLGPGGSEVFSLLADEWPLAARANALSGAIKGTAFYDLVRAQLLIEQLKALSKDLPKDPTTLASVSECEKKVLYALARSQPAEALKIEAKRGSFDWPARDIIAREAVKKGENGLASEALRAAAQTLPSNVMAPLPGIALSRLAVIAARFDKTMSDNLWRKSENSLRFQMSSNESESIFRNYSELAEYAFLRASLEPEKSRFLLETNWYQAQRAMSKVKGPVQNRTHENLVGAMMPLDPLRALEMLASTDAEAKDPFTYRAIGASRIIAYLLADDKERAILQAEYN